MKVFSVEQNRCGAWWPDLDGAHFDRVRDQALDGLTMLGMHDHYQPQAHVEGPVHLLTGDVAFTLNEVKDRRPWPGFDPKAGRESFRQDAGHVVDQPAARDVRDAGEQRQHRLYLLQNCRRMLRSFP